MPDLRGIWRLTGWLQIGGVVYISLMPHPPEPLLFDHADKLEHALTYCFLMLWFCQFGKLNRLRLAATFVAMGVGLEILQGMTGYRFFEYADILSNSMGVLLGWILARTRLGRTLEFLEQWQTKNSRY